MSILSTSHFWGTCEIRGVAPQGCLLINARNKEALGTIGCWRSFCREHSSVCLTALRRGSRFNLECRFSKTPSLGNVLETLPLGPGTATRFVSDSELVLYDAPFGNLASILEKLCLQLARCGLRSPDQVLGCAWSPSFGRQAVTSSNYSTSSVAILAEAIEQFFEVRTRVPVVRTYLHPNFASSMLSGKRVERIEPGLLKFSADSQLQGCENERTGLLSLIDDYRDAAETAPVRYAFGGWSDERALVWIYWPSLQFKSGLFLLTRSDSQWKLLEVSHDEDWVFESHFLSG